ncbi:MAG: hypothetical protein V4702_04740 [Patescibacteria group bacterium]
MLLRRNRKQAQAPLETTESVRGKSAEYMSNYEKAYNDSDEHAARAKTARNGKTLVESYRDELAVVERISQEASDGSDSLSMRRLGAAFRVKGLDEELAADRLMKKANEIADKDAGGHYRANPDTYYEAALEDAVKAGENIQVVATPDQASAEAVQSKATPSPERPVYYSSPH